MSTQTETVLIDSREDLPALVDAQAQRIAHLEAGLLRIKKHAEDRRMVGGHVVSIAIDNILADAESARVLKGER